jgi:DGQHR domain-containing protein
MTTLQEVRARFARDPGLPLADSLTESCILDALNEHGVTFRDRLFNPVTTIWGFLSQVLSDDHSCRDAVWRIKRGAEGHVLGYQRPEVLRHIRQIREYLETADALLPNAVVVAFDGRVRFTPSGRGRGYSRPGTLAIAVGGAEDEKGGWLVDGQQRVAALRDAAVGPFPVCVVGFVAASTDQQREQFILVNSTQPLPRGLL